MSDNYYEFICKDYGISTFGGNTVDEAEAAFTNWHGYTPLGLHRIISSEQYEAEEEAREARMMMGTTPSRDGWTGD